MRNNGAACAFVIPCSRTSDVHTPTDYKEEVRKINKPQIVLLYINCRLRLVAIAIL
jgi:hypothetical protein